MRKEKPLYILLGILFIAYVVVEYYSPKPIDWTITFSEVDPNPFGSYVLYERLEDIFPNKSRSFQTLPELKDSEGHVFILASEMNMSRVEIEALFEILHQGRSILISAQYISESFLDTLGIQFQYNHLNPLLSDSTALNFENNEYYFPSSIINSYFRLDSLEEWNTHGEANGPVLISKDYGSAKLILSSTPLVFTNYGMLHNNSHLLIAEALRLMPNENLVYSRYYHAGKPEARTPLRYVLSKAPLQSAVYLSVFVVLLFLIVNSRRFQRMVPVIEPPKNTTVHFIKTIGGLYHREGSHGHAAQKIINHFLKTLAEKYHISSINESTFPVIAAKTGVSLEDVLHTFSLIQSVKHAPQVSEESLKKLYDKINLFKIH